MSDLGVVKAAQVITSATGITTSSPYKQARGPSTYQVTLTTTSTGVSAVIAGAAVVQVSNDNVGWIPMGTCSPTGTATASDGFAAVAVWNYARFVVTTLTTGVSANLNALIGS